jgi:hypothetical protein
MKKSPIASTKERFESKEKLVQAVEQLATEDLWLDRVNETKGLGKVSNRKLLHLHDLLSDAKKRFGSRQKLIDAILELARRSKDQGYASRLGAYPLPRLLDLHGSLSKGQRRAEAKAKGKPKAVKKATAAPKAAKKAVAKKTTSKAPGAKKTSKRPPAKR